MAFNDIKTESQCMEMMADKEEDRISGLPDDVLSDILSFLELREAVRTSVLSKRWKKVWTLIHRIHLNNNDLNIMVEDERRINFINSVNGILTGNNKLSVTSFSLSYAFGLIIFREIECLTEWIAAVATPKLQKFEFHVSYEYRFLPMKLPPTLFECQKLVILTLDCHSSNMKICVDVPETVCLPRLEKLRLTSVLLEDENTLKNLLSGCPVLEELIMIEIKLLHRDYRIQNLFVFSPSLKILRVHQEAFYSAGFFRYVIDAPKLEYLDLLLYSLLGFSMSSSPSLVSAEIHISTVLSNPSPLTVAELFRGISDVQKLKLFISNVIMFEDELVNLPEFSNLIHFKIGQSNGSRRIVNHILQKSPNLKYLVFFENHVDSPSYMWSQPDSVPFMWSQPDSAPKCLESHLETIEISIRDNVEDALKIVQYFLDKGKVLKKMAIATYEKNFDSRLMGFPRASNQCQILISTLPDPDDEIFFVKI